MSNNDLLLAIGRILLALIYFIGAVSWITGDLPIGYAESKGVPAIGVWIALGIKLLGGLAVIIGFQTRIAAAVIIVFTIATAFIFHPFWVEGEWNTFWKEISMIGGFLVLIAAGPGSLSVDGRKSSPA
jgi:putative oxidoreductase